jgi:PAS domain S-box-containing protein
MVVKPVRDFALRDCGSVSWRSASHGLLIERYLQTAPFVSLFLFAIMFAAWFGGLRPGLVATALSILAFDYYFVSPIHSLVATSNDALRIVLFGIIALFVVLLISMQRSATESLRRTRDDLQVALRELQRVNNALQAENAERKRAEQKSRQAEQELQVTIDTIPALAASYQRDGSPDFVNQTWRNYTGLSLDDVKARGWEAVLHPDDLASVESERRAHLATEKPFQMEHRLRRADGEYRWHLFSRVPLRDKNGEMIKWYAAGYDIEDQKRAEIALRRSQAYLDEAQRLSHTGSFAWRVASGDIVWSKEAYRILGVDRRVKPTIDLILQRVHPDDRELVQHEIDRAAQGEQDYDYEHRYLAPNGAVKRLHVRARRVRSESGEEEIIGALMEVTATREAQEALHRAQTELAHVTRVTTLGEMSASLAHEVNQPLTAIVTNGEASLRWLNRENPDLAEAVHAVRRMVSEANRAGGVIRRIRELAKKADPEVIQLDINEVIDEAVTLVHHEALSHRVAIRLQLAPGLPPVRGDRIQLQQVIINLVVNGIQAMSALTDRARELFIRTKPHEADQVLVAIQDVGVGMEPESSARLFSPFYTTKPDGMGMGLSICRSIIEAHGGRVWASPNIGPGTTFQFVISAHRQD